MQSGAKKNISQVKKLCGDNFLSKVVLATTMWDITEKDLAEARERQLEEKKEYWGYMISKLCFKASPPYVQNPV